MAGGCAPPLARLNRTVNSSTTSTDSTASRYGAVFAVGPLARSMLTFTASALNGVPSWKEMSSRSAMSIDEPSAANSQLSASMPSTT